jgi:hypothetical protein
VGQFETDPLPTQGAEKGIQLVVETNSYGRRTLTIASSAAVVVVPAVVGMGVLSAMDLRDPFDHGIGHAVGAAAATVLLVLALRYWRPPVAGAVSRAARLVLVAGFGVFAVGQALEMVGAFWLDGVHSLALYPATLGLLLTMLGALSSMVVAAAARLNLLDSRWTRVALVVPVAAVVLFVVGAFVFGY